MIDGRFLAICDCNFSANSGQWEVVDQRDWNVPEFNNLALKELCEKTECDEDCKHCVVTRIKEAVLEEQY